MATEHSCPQWKDSLILSWPSQCLTSGHPLVILLAVWTRASWHFALFCLVCFWFSLFLLLAVHRGAPPLCLHGAYSQQCSGAFAVLRLKSGWTSCMQSLYTALWAGTHKLICILKEGDTSWVSGKTLTASHLPGEVLCLTVSVGQEAPV